MKVKTILKVLKEYYIGKSFDLYRGFYGNGSPSTWFSTIKDDGLSLNSSLVTVVVKDVICYCNEGGASYHLTFVGTPEILCLVED